MYKTLGSLAVLLFAVALTVGCGDSKTKTTTEKKTPAKGGGSLVAHGDFYEVCEKCGEIEGSVNCCQTGDDIKICKKCGKHEGSPGCCEEGHIHVCKKCGEIEGSTNCCKTGEDIKICEKCSKHEGSPGCCVKFKSAEDKKPEKKKEPIEAPKP